MREIKRLCSGINKSLSDFGRLGYLIFLIAAFIITICYCFRTFHTRWQANASYLQLKFDETAVSFFQLYTYVTPIVIH